MKMKNLMAVTAVSATFFVPSFSLANPFTPSNAPAGNLLTGDTRLACEAILCLSSGDRPSECKPSLERYFSIKHKKMHRTIDARRNFLNMCPSSKEDNMPQLVNALANGAGRCDATELSRVMRVTYKARVCPKKPRFSRHDSDSCYWETRSYVRNAKPSYCSAYFDHKWTTAGERVRFVGTEKEGGRWVDVK
ncbi:TrbM/KikA/MpfK family conjugal transfer protein [Kingella kingae]|uniref:TrbM/KikA/MpfK family conjugal transfer protein n=1 Tax=Kingella kingae TaxID=504 RepID=UPI0003F62CB4|nr:TrbM/KikA/MpfK family conjugal transfer protein [Kingella kingae]